MRILMALLLTSMFLLMGCEEKGPAEKLGANIDEKVTEAKNKLEDTCEEVKEAVDAKDKDC